MIVIPRVPAPAGKIATGNPRVPAPAGFAMGYQRPAIGSAPTWPASSTIVG